MLPPAFPALPASPTPPAGGPVSRRLALVVLAGAAGVAACAAPVAPTARFDPARRMGPTLWQQGMPGYRFEQLRVNALDGAYRYRLWLAVPDGPVPAAGHPLLCMLDGNAVADTLRGNDLAALSQAGHAPVIAALGPDSDLRFDVDRRAYDYTPAVRSDGPTWDDEARGRRGGGADSFLCLWSDALLPRITQHVRVDPSRRTIWGHSYGGLFVLHALFTRPEVFTRYAAADASLWWQDGFILREAERAVQLPGDRRTSLLLMQGEASPEASPPQGTDPARLAQMRRQRAAVAPDAAERLVATQAQRPGVRAEHRRFAGTGHGPMLAASIPPALRLATTP